MICILKVWLEGKSGVRETSREELASLKFPNADRRLFRDIVSVTDYLKVLTHDYSVVGN